ncbi:MAG TPA: hypothetical protein VM008_09520 [Phycisphaerae bacterium]|nr:hypothetical protein [Phycisphaerae bacterium]
MMIFSGGYWEAAVWGVVVLASWVGWGELVRCAVGVGPERVGWALRAGWGMAAVLGISGVLEAFHMGDQRALTAIALIGLGMAGLEAWSRIQTRRPVKKREGIAWSYVLLGVLLAYLYATSVVTWDLNWWDDLPNYLVYVQKILHTGTLIEPYSLRRIVTYGGQQTLEAMVLLGGTFFNADILEMGLGRLLFVGLLLEMVRPAGRREQVAAGIALIVLVLVPRVPVTTLNTQSEMTGVVLFLTLLRTLGLGRGEENQRWVACVAGVVAAAVCTMRANFLPGAEGTLIVFYGVRAVRERERRKGHAVDCVIAVGSCAAALVGWAVVLDQSSGTPLFPLWRGNQRADYLYFDSGLTLWERVRWVVGFVGYPGGFALMAPLLLVVHRRFWRAELPMVVAAMLTVVLTLLSFTLTEYTNLYRLVFPVVFGVSAVMMLRLVVQPGSKTQWWAGVAVLGLTAALNLVPGIEWAVGERGKVWVEEEQSPLAGVAQNEGVYREAQGAVPVGATMLSATSFPVLFDYSRNPIFIADVPGAVNPPPGMPIFQGAGAMREYLLGQGIEYVVFTFPDMDRTLYSRAYWEPIFEGTRAANPDEVRCSKYNVAFIRCMDGLPATGKVLFRSRTLCVVRLR